MPAVFHQLIARGYWAPAGDDGSDAGGTGSAVDRGDNVTSPLDNAGKEGDKLDPDSDKSKAEDDKSKDEDLETEEEKAERERLEAEEEKKKRTRIPKARFDEAIGKARAREAALLEEIEKLKGGQQATATAKAVDQMKSKIDSLQDEYEELILDGKKEEARKIRKEVENLREELQDYRVSVKSDAARSAAVEELTFNAKLASYESQYSALNPEHPDFDEDKTDEVAELLKTFVKAGTKRDVALARAVKYVLGAPEAAKNDTATQTAADRAAAARKKAADADRKQPPDAKNVGLDSDKAGGKGSDVNVLQLTQDKFAKLDEDTKARLRGDTV